MDERDFLFLQLQDSSDLSSDDSNYESSSESSSEISMMDVDDDIDEAMQVAVSILLDLEGGMEDATIRWRERHEVLLFVISQMMMLLPTFVSGRLTSKSCLICSGRGFFQFLPGAGSPYLVVAQFHIEDRYKFNRLLN